MTRRKDGCTKDYVLDITSHIQVDKAIRNKFFIIGCNDLQYHDYLVPK